ncbi:MAG: transcription elongation factor GreA [Parcubacteria group bacterium Gr01-1014_31]|nr:MAG: transcription elongation factor GreA [Parcubacteria group bacterium Gr01-1014_31]
MNPYLTREGLEKLKKELDELKSVKRQEVINRIKVAREQGDLSENAEYADAKDEQSFIEGRILELENLTNKAVIIDADVTHHDVVSLGMTVTVDCGGRTLRYTIVGSNEADPSQGMISNESPLGRAFLGKRVGEKVQVMVPKGEMECMIVDLRQVAA